MIAFISLIYASFYFLFFKKFKIFEQNARNISIFVGIGVVLIGAIVFIWLTVAPNTPDGRMFQYVIQIVPQVSGQVVEVPVKPLVQLKRGDVLYKIDPRPYQYSVDQLTASIEQAQAQKRLAQIEVDRNTGLVQRSAAAQRDLDRWNAELDGAEALIQSLEAQLGNAQWRLGETVVRAPYDGYIVNLQVRPGTFVAVMPIAAAATFVSDELKEVVASFSQSSMRKVKKGDSAEVVFPMFPGRVFSGTVTELVRATGTAQLTPSGAIPVATWNPTAGRYVVRVELDNPDDTEMIPQGAGGTVAVYTDIGKPFHIITKVMMRMNAWMAYLTSPV